MNVELKGETVNPNDPNQPNTPTPENPQDGYGPQQVPQQPSAGQGGFAAPEPVQPQSPEVQPAPAVPEQPAQPEPGFTNVTPQAPSQSQQPNGAQDFQPQAPANPAAAPVVTPEAAAAPVPQQDDTYQQPQSFGGAPANSEPGKGPRKKAKFPVRLIALVVGALAALAFIAAAIWLAINLLGGPQLERHEASTWEISVPQDWDVQQSSQDSRFFTSTSESDDSTVTVGAGAVPSEYREEYVSFYRVNVEEETLGAGYIDSSHTLDDYSHSEITHAGIDGEEASATILNEEDEDIGRIFVRVLFDEDVFYTIAVVAFNDSELSGSEGRVFSSFAVRETADDTDEDS